MHSFYEGAHHGSTQIEAEEKPCSTLKRGSALGANALSAECAVVVGAAVIIVDARVAYATGDTMTIAATEKPTLAVGFVETDAAKGTGRVGVATPLESFPTSAGKSLCLARFLDLWLSATIVIDGRNTKTDGPPILHSAHLTTPANIDFEKLSVLVADLSNSAIT